MTPRVVVLTTYYRPVVGGVESNAERLAQYFYQTGVPVQVVTKRIGADLSDAETIDGVDVRRIGPLGVRSPAGKWALIPAAIRWLLRHRADYDIVCCVDFRGIGLAPILARAVTGRPVLLQAQTPGAFSGAYAPGGRAGRLLLSPVLALYRRADAFACIGRALEQEARHAGFPRERIHFVPNPVDMRHFRPAADAGERANLRRRFGIADGAIAFAFVGRLSREKGIRELVDAWGELMERRRNAAVPLQLLVAGPDMTGHAWNAGPDVRALVEEKGLGGSVAFLGGDATIPLLLRAVDVAVQPSHFEAQGLSAIEALATGVPVVASAVGGLLDFIVDGVNGRLVPPRDPHALADALLDLAEAPSMRLQMAATARDSVRRAYDEREVFGRLAGLLTSLGERRS